MKNRKGQNAELAAGRAHLEVWLRKRLAAGEEDDAKA